MTFAAEAWTAVFAGLIPIVGLVAVANNYFEIDTRGQRTRRPQRVVWHGNGGAVISQHPAAGS